ncbi:MAG: GIY-YIG nuclease family protein [Chloroflexi bacterium]|nr:GIY-YIG nuclease family protein [Chloroflexota bacterium]
MPYFCYLLECADGSFYCGWTTDVERRLRIHQRGKGARYTRINGPVKLAYFEEVEDRRAAMKREIVIKRLPHEKKKKMAEEFPREQLPGT